MRRSKKNHESTPELVPDHRQWIVSTKIERPTLGTATGFSSCGCSQTRLLELKEDVWIEWVRCAKHYIPAEDDPMILSAAANRRRLDEEDRRRLSHPESGWKLRQSLMQRKK